jgi:hypothetical protein
VKYQLTEQTKTIAELFKLGLYSEEEARTALSAIGWLPEAEQEGEVPEAHGGVGFYVPSDNQDEEDED